MFGDQPHFGCRCGDTTFDLLPDRFNQRDTGYKYRLLVVLQIIFRSGVAEDPALGDQTATDADAYPGSRKNYTTSCGS